jgi:hypothetical protein
MCAMGANKIRPIPRGYLLEKRLQSKLNDASGGGRIYPSKGGLDAHVIGLESHAAPPKEHRVRATIANISTPVLRQKVLLPNSLSFAKSSSCLKAPRHTLT